MFLKLFSLFFQNYSKTIYSNFYNLENDANLSDFTKKQILFLRLNPGMLTPAIKSLELKKDEHSIEIESDSEATLSANEDNNSDSTSTSS